MGKLIERFASELRGTSETTVAPLVKDGVSDPFERYAIAEEKKERFEVTFGATSPDGSLYGSDEFGVKLVLEKDPSKAAAFATYARNVWGVIEDDDDGLAAAASVAETLVGKASGHGAVA